MSIYKKSKMKQLFYKATGFDKKNIIPALGGLAE